MHLFVAHDAGPANYLGFIAKALGKEACYLGSPVSLAAFEELLLIPFDSSVNRNLTAVVTGTCMQSGIDKEYTMKAKAWGIPSVAVIEHWSWYRERFLLGNDLVLPDYIAVNDAYAMQQCIDAGLPPDKIRVLGNPVLENSYLQGLAIRNPLEIKAKYNIADHETCVVFISESLRTDFPEGSPEHQGFDEFSVLNDLVALCEKHSLRLIVKLHPAEKPDKYSELSIGYKLTIMQSMPKEDIFALADFMVGMGSMLLLEASVAGVKQVISYRPNERMPFIGNVVGASSPAHDLTALETMILNPTSGITPVVFGKQFIGSTQRFIRFLHSITG